MITFEPDGSITFSVSIPDARTVELVGTIDGWTEERRPMTRSDDGGVWRLCIDPGPGEFCFRYLVDGIRWVLDDEAHGEVAAADGTVRSRAWQPPPRQDPDSLAA
jgi:1,4-alpha-glucan branching enzyme